jgi:hypothetical protein
MHERTMTYTTKLWLILEAIWFILSRSVLMLFSLVRFLFQAINIAVDHLAGLVALSIYGAILYAVIMAAISS